MFFFAYLGRELRRRMRQAIFIALGLALGVGLVITVAAASAGVKKAQSGVLTTLYGVGTDITVTGAAPGPPKTTQPGSGGGQQIQITPSGAEICTNGKCENAAGQTIDHLSSQYSSISASKVAKVAKLHDVSAAAGGLTLTDTAITIPANFGSPGSSSAPPQPSTFSVDGVDTSHPAFGPLSAGTLTSGHSFTAADSGSDVAVVDSDYAKANSLKVGSTVKIVGVKFTVIGIVSQAQGSSPTDVYIPLARAQALANAPGSGSGHLDGDVNTVYVTTSSSADITAVQHEISKLLPGSTVTTASSLASEITGSVTSAATLANDLGKWLSVLVLIAAFAVASLLTMSAVARRVREFGTLKALGWRSRRIMMQVLGESVAMGIVGAVAGVGLGFAGAAIIGKVAPKLSASVPGQGGGLFQQSSQSSGGGGAIAARPIGGATSHTVSVLLSPSVTATAIVLAVALAILGGLLAGSFGSWRIARLRPADALARVA
jgi:putative ABC transport system permease protein